MIEEKPQHPPAPNKQYGIYNTEDVCNGDKGFMMLFDTIEDAVLEYPHHDIYEMPLKNLGKFSLTVKRILKKKTKRSKK